MVCPNCGTQISNTATFCVKCGANVKLESSMEETVGQASGRGYYDNFSSNTNVQNDTVGGYMPGGYGVSPVSGPAGTPPAKKSGTRGVLYALIAVAALLVVVTAVFATVLVVNNGGINGKNSNEEKKIVRNEDEDENTDSTAYNEDADEITDSKVKKPNTKPQEPVTPKEKVLVSEYTVVKSNASWTAANNDAYNRGGHLVYINDYAEFNKVCSLAEQYGLHVFWVGAARNYGSSWTETTWGDGSYLWASWSSGEPSYAHSGEAEQYLMVYKVNGIWGYNDSPNDVSSVYSSSKMGYIIETESYEYR